MRAMKRCSVSFGLVNIPVRVYKAVENHDVALHQYHDKDLLPIGYTKACKGCGSSVDEANIVKGVTIDDEVIVLTEDELLSLKDEQSPNIEVLQFVHADDIDPIMYEGSYYLEPDSSLDGYALLRTALDESGLLAIVSLSMRAAKMHLGALRVVGKMMVLHTMRWPDEVRPAEFAVLDKEVEIKPATMKAALQLVQAMVAPFDPTEFTDNYTERVNELIEAKASKTEFKAKPQDLDSVSATDVDDLLAKLEASVKRHPAGRAKAKPAAKKAVPRKAAAKKAAARRRGAA